MFYKSRFYLIEYELLEDDNSFCI